MSLASAYMRNGTEPKTRLSAVAICDILGFSEVVRTADREGRANELLASLRDTLESWYSSLTDKWGFDGHRHWEVKAFTDNVVIGIPVQRDAADQAVAHLLMSVGSVQRGLTLEGGFFVRGGAALGHVYIDGSIVYGSGLLDAYDRERKAIVPRVLLDESATDTAFRLYRSTTRRSPLGGYVLRDEDGGLFANYLDCVWLVEDEPPNYGWLARHQELILEALERFKSDMHILAKYLWVARYHNYICNLIPDAETYSVRDLHMLNASSIA